MRRHKEIFLIIGLIIGLVASAPVLAADFAKVGTVGSQFLKIPIGARGTAMGNGFAALSNDGSAMFWNPAGLVYVDGTTVMLERVEYVAEMELNAVAVAKNFDNLFTAGLFAATFSSGDIARTTVEQPMGTGDNFQVTNFQVGVTGATRFTDKFSLGGNIKLVREDLDGEIASEWVVDIGSMYDTKWNSLKLSMAIRNFGPEIQLDGNYHDYDNGERLETPTDFLPYHIPMTYKLGLVGDPIMIDDHRLTVVAELEHPNDNIERYNVGGEYAFQEMFFLRGGYTFRHDTLGLSSGLGARWNKFGIDYAYSDYSILEGVHQFNISFSF